MAAPISLLKGHKFTVSQVCYDTILMIKNIELVDSFSVVSFFVGRKLECTKIHDLLEMVAECYAAPHFWVYNLHQITPSNN